MLWAMEAQVMETMSGVEGHKTPSVVRGVVPTVARCVVIMVRCRGVFSSLLDC